MGAPMGPGGVGEGAAGKDMPGRVCDLIEPREVGKPVWSSRRHTSIMTRATTGCATARACADAVT
jgi:hypothetical protein